MSLVSLVVLAKSVLISRRLVPECYNCVSSRFTIRTVCLLTVAAVGTPVLTADLVQVRGRDALLFLRVARSLLYVSLTITNTTRPPCPWSQTPMTSTPRGFVRSATPRHLYASVTHSAKRQQTTTCRCHPRFRRRCHSTFRSTSRGRSVDSM